MLFNMYVKSLRHLALLLAAPLATQAIADIHTDYQNGVADAAFLAQSEIDTNLNAITPDNKSLVWNADKTKVLVSTWKAQGAYDKFMKPYTKTSDNPAYAVWVTAVPQVHALCSAFLKTNADKSKQALDLRLKQYLGLSPDWNYDMFVEMWVSPDDMFRPCVDPQVDDKTCNLQFGDTTPKVKNIPDYQDFYSDLYYKSYRASAGVPWTGVGYTYDWGNPDSDVGASEYILVPGANYEIKRAVPTEQYCAAN